ncbi:DUF192 domain-containing protein [Thioalkalivibrio sp. XN279]|uniref:DUF192 domain-containing protein n=1 Tax=Thioalkalivibrio sp. XN279 TaxID=2714953 RepID=UPI00197D9EAC
MRRYLLPGLCVLALVLALHTMTLASGALGDLPLEQAEVVGADGTRHVFAVRLADTPETRARGLMYVTALEPDHGMLFDFGETRMVGMWMKNTPLSLDMLFITADGVIAKIAPETTPFSTGIVSSGRPVRAVLEIRGGRAAELGIMPGDRVLHRVFD